ncbi:MAG: flagellar biosynthetic protein FliQ [Thermoguttaceae bacterium]|nr:flagellar biosynthetic protein FliQ [Thermoguttaceae bacterium]
METETAIALGREALQTMLAIGAPALVVCVLVGLATGILQAATQIQDQAFATVLKIVATFATVAIFLPWSVARLAEFARNLWEQIPETTTFFGG